jgi:hypothetical protein
MIIGLCGPARVGKTTAALYLEEKYGFTRLPFKSGLVAELTERLNRTLSAIAKDTYGEATPKTITKLIDDKPNDTIRSLMQEYGTEVRRRDNEDYWVDIWIETIAMNPRRSYVVEDVRFFNELKAVKDMGGELIRIARQDIVALNDHQSEKEQELFIEDFLIEGKTGNVGSTYRQIDEIIKTLKFNIA